MYVSKTSASRLHLRNGDSIALFGQKDAEAIDWNTYKNGLAPQIQMCDYGRSPRQGTYEVAMLPADALAVVNVALLPTLLRHLGLREVLAARTESSQSGLFRNEREMIVQGL